jgi:hypothetical protein
MLDESEDETNIFTLSVGNIPPHCDVVIKITYLIFSFFSLFLPFRVIFSCDVRYVAEVSVEGNHITFVLPATIAPTKRDRMLKVNFFYFFQSHIPRFFLFFLSFIFSHMWDSY